MSNALTIQSIADFESVVGEWEGKFFNPGVGFPTIWYRGQSRGFPPLPGILRQKFLALCDDDETKLIPVGQRLWNKERTINRQFRRMSSSLVSGQMSAVGLYFLAQHHGLPTRLMDWTMNPLSALYFATSGSHDEDGVVFVFNPKEMGQLEEMRAPKVAAVVEALFGDGEVPFESEVIPLLPDLFAGRMLQQSSCFTLHTPPLWLNIPGLDLSDEAKYQITPNTVANAVRYVIPKNAKPYLRLTLRRMGITEATLFPDLDHVASELKNAWRL